MTHLDPTGGSTSDPLRGHSVTHLARVSAGQEIAPLYLFSTTSYQEGNPNPVTTDPSRASAKHPTTTTLEAPEGHERSRLFHKPGCPQPDPEVWHGKRETMQSCPSCRISKPLWRAARPAPKAEPAPEVSVPVQATAAVAARYVCRDHLNPVNWRGKGCASCTSDKAQRRTGDPR